MPRLLLDRCQPESIREYRLAARQRYNEAVALWSGGQRTGAIYLWGYASEMLLKAAYFAAIGLGELAPLSVSTDVRSAIQRGRQTYGIPWPQQGAGHNVYAWAQLVVSERSSTPATAYGPAFSRDILRYAAQIARIWRETLRYHKNRAYEHELRQVHRAVSWFLCNTERL